MKLKIDLENAPKGKIRSLAIMLLAFISETEAPGAAETEQAEPAKKAKSKPAKGAAAKKKVTEAEPEDENGDEAITLDMVRDLLSRKAKAHKAEIKAKLAECDEAPNVTKLDPKYYAEIFEFMESLD